MILIQLAGGLGNQLFQYAFGRALAIESGVDLYLDTRRLETDQIHTGYCLNNFNISASLLDEKQHQEFPAWKISLSRKIKLLSRAFFNIYHEKSNKHSQIPMHRKLGTFYIGYWQSEKYFKAHSETISRELEIITPISLDSQKIIAQMEGVNSVSLHIRRGDYTSNAIAKKIYHYLDEEYYFNAMDLMRQKLNNPTFFIFSDDIESAKQMIRLQENVFYVSDSNTTAIDELNLMTNCKNHIIANSTFSWWGAWLGKNKNKIVVAPKSWFKTDLNSADIIPDEWIQL
ncbi:alpha-1,2-fucosyltransferase [Chromobacterium violaceum]|uniref:alpha-1,2-fucosyltransferase n=1 Tax=Chromobacterium violaceum TaxID=536 RepID=UPI0009BC6A42|nr:alpha-1,2-fucosyltransferase [Chromobacterium violaceum]